jgi:hypothetical protein
MLARLMSLPIYFVTHAAGLFVLLYLLTASWETQVKQWKDVLSASSIVFLVVRSMLSDVATEFITVSKLLNSPAVLVLRAMPTLQKTQNSSPIKLRKHWDWRQETSP